MLNPEQLKTLGTRRLPRVHAFGYKRRLGFELEPQKDGSIHLVFITSRSGLQHRVRMDRNVTAELSDALTFLKSEIQTLELDNQGAETVVEKGDVS